MNIPSGRRVGSDATLHTALVMQRFMSQIADEFDLALLQARRDGWSLRALSDHLGISYSNVKRFSARAETRGQ